MERRHSLAKSFGFAFEGIRIALIKGRNFKIQLVLGLIASIIGVILKLSAVEMTILFLTITFVLVLELINTGVESIVDLVSPEIRDKAKIAKDVSAAGVLIASIASILVGVILFVPKLI